MTSFPSLRLTGARVLRDGQLTPAAISVEAGRFSDDLLPTVDLAGYLVLPGIVDLQGRAFERHIAPRATAPLPVGCGLTATERDAAANGVTTGWLAQSWSWEGGLRGPGFAEAMLADFDTRPAVALIDLRPAIRLETHMVESRDRLLTAVARHRVKSVTFANRLPQYLQMAARAPHKLAALAERDGESPEALNQRIEAARAHAGALPRHLLKLTEGFDRLGVRYGSCEDPDADTRERFRMLGAHLAAFPLSLSAATAARAMGDPVLLRAPDVMRGSAPEGSAPVMTMIARDLCTALTSDNHYPSLAAAAWALADRGARGFAAAWAMISTHPARLMGLEDRGRIAPGLRADFVVIHETSRRIEATVSGGRIAHLSGSFAGRLLNRIPNLALAAE